MERTQEYVEIDLGAYEPPPLRVIPTIRVAAKTDLGRVRDNNEDKLEFYQPDKPEALAGRGAAFLVCDGMGGHAAGQIASELACKTFLDIYYRSSANYIADAAMSAAQEAHRYVVDVARTIPGRQGMGTTLTALIVCQDQGLVVQVGDSRCYRLNGSEFAQLTTDQTVVEEYVALGMLTREQAEVHPNAHMLTQAIGAAEVLKPDILPITIVPGERFLLCSDGLTNHVANEEIEAHMMEYGPSDCCWRLVNLALDRGGSDNCTVVVVEIAALAAAQD